MPLRENHQHRACGAGGETGERLNREQAGDEAISERVTEPGPGISQVCPKPALGPGAQLSRVCRDAQPRYQESRHDEGGGIDGEGGTGPDEGNQAAGGGGRQDLDQPAGGP